LGSAICEDVEAIFRATGGSTYEFFVDASSVQGPSAIDTFAISTLQDGEVVSVKVIDANNCEDTHAGIAMSIIAAPNILLTSSATTICAGEEVTFTASNASTYTFYLNGVIVLGHDGSAIFKTTTLSDGDEVYVVGNDGTCEAPSSNISVTVNPLPTATLTTTPSTTVIEGTNLTFTGSGGIEYEFSVFRSGVETIVQSQGVIDNWSTDTLIQGDIVIVDVYDANGCTASDSDTLTILEGILPLDVQATDTQYCFGDNGVSIYIATPQDGITYELLRNSDNGQEGASIMFNTTSPVPVRWDNITAPSGSEDYRVEGYYNIVPADRIIMNDTITIIENPLPTVYNLTSPSASPATGCNDGLGHDIELSDSQVDFIYKLLVNGIEVDQKIGDGDSITFPGNLIVGIYTIIAEDNNTGCQKSMSGQFEIQPDAPVVTYDVFAVGKSDSIDGRYCAGDAGVEIGLSGSLDNTVSYTLYRDGADTGISLPGANSEISFGIQSTDGVYTVRVESATGCEFPMNGQVNVSQVSLPTTYTMTTDNNGHYCIGDNGVTLGLAGQEQDIRYILYRDFTIPIDSVSGDIADVSFTFFNNDTQDGYFSIEGDYSVTADIPQVGCAVNMDDTITIVENLLPLQYDVFSDDVEYCTGESTNIYITNSEANVEYNWYEVTNGVYGGTWKSGNGSIVSFDITATGDYSIRGRRTDVPSACESIMNDTISITEKPLPTDVTLAIVAFGTDCQNGDSIQVQDTELGVEYRLAKVSGGTYYEVPGVPYIYGNGGDTAFVRIVDANAYYSVIAIKNGCSIESNDSVQVDVPGVIQRQTVTGDGEICNGDPGVIFGLKSTEVGIVYELRYQDGSSIETITGDGNAVSFTMLNQEGEYYVVGDPSGCNLEMANRVTLNVNPLPIAYEMFGSGLTCDLVNDGALLGLLKSETNYNYTLQFDDGSGIIENTTVIPGRIDGDSLKHIAYKEGTFTFVATSDKGCTSSMNGSVTVSENSSPVDHVVVAYDTTYCDSNEGVEILLADNEGDILYWVISNDNDTIKVSGEASGGQLSLGTYPTGEYSIWATRGGDACITQINNEDTVKIGTPLPDPSNRSVTVDKRIACVSDTITVSIEGGPLSALGFAIIDDTGTGVSDTITGYAATNDTIWKIVGDVASTKAYNVVAISEITCGSNIATINVEFKEGPDEFNIISDKVINPKTGKYEYCVGDGGISLGVDMAQNNVLYKIFSTSDPTQDIGFIVGPGNNKYFLEESGSKKFGAGEYAVSATLYTSGCSKIYEDTVRIDTLSLPETFPIACSIESETSCLVGGNLNIEESTVLGVKYYLAKILSFDIINNKTIYEPVDSIMGQGSPVNFDPISIGGEYSVVAMDTNTTCKVLFPDFVHFANKPLVALPDSLNLSSNSLSNDIRVSTNDILTVGVDSILPMEDSLRTNVKYWLYDEKNDTVVSSIIKDIGIYTLDPITSNLRFDKTPGFYGKDSIKYIVENTSFDDRSDTTIVYLFVGNKTIIGDRSFLIPNAFSPNGDGINDKFVISGISKGKVQAQTSSLEVFNRWGTLVYRSKGKNYVDGLGLLWDGTSSTSNMVSIGSELPNGTYFYVFTVKVNISESGKEQREETKKYSGYVELRR
jgi:gliding motility-associated-like protein